jgi:hypothetical protein
VKIDHPSFHHHIQKHNPINYTIWRDLCINKVKLPYVVCGSQSPTTTPLPLDLIMASISSFELITPCGYDIILMEELH